MADFAPLDLNEGLHPVTSELMEQLVIKLINAEQACYRSSVFLGLEQRTRLSMLAQVSDTLVSDSNKFLQPVHKCDMSLTDLLGELKAVHAIASQACTEETCPLMTAGRRYEDRWETAGKICPCSAPSYCAKLFEWAEEQLLDARLAGQAGGARGGG